MKPTALFPLALILFASCQAGGSRGDGLVRLPDGGEIRVSTDLPYKISHTEFYPPSDSIPLVTDPRLIIHDAPDDTLHWMLHALQGGNLIGVAEGNPNDMFGVIADVAVGGSLVYYADQQSKDVRAYDFEGRLVDIIGGPGQGPAEFGLMSFVAVTGTGGDVHVVVGSGARRVSVFRKSGDGSHEFQTSFNAATRFLNGDMCAMNGHVYTTGYSEDHEGAIHKHTLHGTYVSSFGTVSSHPDRMAKRLMAERGSLECNEPHGVLLYAYPSMPIATAFEESGKELWQVRLADARIVPKLLMFSKEWGLVGAANWPVREGGSEDIDVTGEAQGDAFWLVRRELLTKDRKRWMAHFYRMDVLSGQGEYLGKRPIHTEESKRAVRVIARGHVFTTRSEPYPQLGIHPFSDEAQYFGR